jgi:tryptophanyl-tRNA synthetase
VLPETPDGLKNRPEAQNLITIFSAVSGIPVGEVCHKFAGGNFTPFKKELTEHLINHLIPIGDRMRELMEDPQELDTILAEGADIANNLAEKNMQEVRKVIGLLQK